VISRLQVQGGSAGVVSVEVSLQAAKYQEAETHFKQALQLHCKVEASRSTLRGATARAAAGKPADKAADEGP